MSSDEPIICANCHARLSRDARVCGMCGTRVGAAPREEARPPVAENAKPAPSDEKRKPSAPYVSSVASSVLQRNPSESFMASAPSAVPPPRPLPKSSLPPPPRRSENAPSIAVRAPDFMKVGVRTLLDISFADERDLYESVVFKLYFDNREISSAALYGRPGILQRAVQLYVTPRNAGHVKFRLDAVCGLQGGADETYSCEVPVVVDAQETGQSVINISSVNSGHASDQCINVNLPSSAGDGNHKKYDSSSYEWRTDFVLRSSLRRLSLVAESANAPEVLQLIPGMPGTAVSFGRNRLEPECPKVEYPDITLRVMGPEGLRESKGNKSVSGRHFSLAFDEFGRCRLQDHSSYGTRVDGMEVKAATCQLQPGSYHVAIGRPDMELPMKFHVAAERVGGVAGVLIERRDAAAERIAVVKRKVEFPDGSEMLWDGLCWRAHVGGALVPLSLHTTVTIDGRAYVVRPFDQEEFIHPEETGCRYCRAFRTEDEG